MKKKYYISFLLLGSLLIFLILPAINYHTDQWRVLHHDYHSSYKGISPNKTFLKVLYLLHQKEQIDTLLMGSSRSGYMDSKLISENAYNMKFNFALAKMHLHNLKTLLKNNITINNLWLGVNDYVIWKDPIDHKSDFQRKLYQPNILNQLDTYAFYLLKKIDDRDIGILTGKYNLYPSEESTNPDKVNMKTAKARERYTVSHAKTWREKMTMIKPTLLGYKDNSYRIDEAIKEISDIAALCKQHDINLTVFMYPSYYKTYLQFNQFKIEEFKRKLASVVNFHDFYMLNEIALDELKWQDSSHFHASIGSYMIKKIKQNTFLIKQNTIEEHLQKNRKKISHILTKNIPIDYIYQFNSHIDLNTLTPIFDIALDIDKISTNDQCVLEKKKGFVQVNTFGPDPILILDTFHPHSENIILNCIIESKEKTMFQIYYKLKKESPYNEMDTYRIPLKKGLNKFNLLIPSSYLHHRIRVDIADKLGIYKINNFSLYETGDSNE